MKLIYLASPYSSPSKVIMNHRYDSACKAVGLFSAMGMWVYSPIVHYHMPSLLIDLPTDSDFWWDINRSMLDRCDMLVVLTLDGWQESKGVKQEIEYAQSYSIPVEYRPMP